MSFIVEKTFLKNIGTPLSPALVFTESELQDVISYEPETLVTIVDTATLYEGHLLCNVEQLDVFFECLNKVYRYREHQELLVTVIALSNVVVNQRDVEHQMFQQGFHVAGNTWLQRHYSNQDGAKFYTTTTFRKVRQSGHFLTDMGALLTERDLHMDMLRECSGRSDAHVYRYVFASRYIRLNDNVLDCACGLGYGSYILSTSGKAGQVLGVDICENSISYANDVYSNANLTYKTLNIDEFEQVGLGQYDLITSFETIEHVVDYHAFFRLCLRNLKPDGRLIASVPYMWVDETGKDPNPFHFHEFDWAKFSALFAEYGFIIEARNHQTAPGGFKLTSVGREFDSVAISEGEIDTEWLVVVATPDLSHPLWQVRCKEPYSNPEYKNDALPLYVDFNRGYENPWLHRQIVQIGQRIENAQVRYDYAEKLLKNGSGDVLMLKTVQGYTDIQSQAWEHDVSLLIDSFDLEQGTVNPFLLRWFVSLTFLYANTQFKQGNWQSARRYFGLIIDVDTNLFCPVLSIKVIESYYYLAKLDLFVSDIKNAKSNLIKGKQAIFQSINAFKKSVQRDEDRVAGFLWPEMADIFDAGALLNGVEILLSEGLSIEEVLSKAKNLEMNKRFGLFNVVEANKELIRTSDIEDMALVAMSVVNKLAAKVIATGIKCDICIWGTGVVARKLYNKLLESGIDIVAFIDSNAVAGELCVDKPVWLPEEDVLAAVKVICITSVGSSDIIAQQVPKNTTCIYMS
ncbi:bifunctional 2-polyprenyl-6-hydroxyphenol methylase/3-demethylubiquinol 3-O-methyltransferase UbiG [Aestuariibacter sp. A3R04]|uniref:class I SAM-dependent methyltransferase n=1 Tax=Aestuariibacter sp. A3R04 TaxID=2841571 RepID=UPI001C09F53F|nr:class I SAM-dependent methyltransferase [Aestuariibacter sp. A3R04]MBU3022187.1 class I SAM-dependent methyltransferase [Aestuariibacter sp. A3R04]